MNTYKEYIELMRIAYPNSTRRFEKSKMQGKWVHIDTASKFNSLGTYLQQDIIRSLNEQIESGKRRLADKENDDYKIIKRRV